MLEPLLLLSVLFAVGSAQVDNDALVEDLRVVFQEELATVEDRVVSRVNDEITHVADNTMFQVYAMIVLIASTLVILTALVGAVKFLWTHWRRLCFPTRKVAYNPVHHGDRIPPP